SDPAHPVVEQTIAIDAKGTIAGELILPASIKTGYYTMQLSKVGSTSTDWSSYSYTYFQVDEFRKPEYFLEVEAVDDEVIRGDSATVSIKGSYFSGLPLLNQEVTYYVYKSQYYESSYYNSTSPQRDFR